MHRSWAIRVIQSNSAPKTEREGQQENVSFSKLIRIHPRDCFTSYDHFAPRWNFCLLSLLVFLPLLTFSTPGKRCAGTDGGGETNFDFSRPSGNEVIRNEKNPLLVPSIGFSLWKRRQLLTLLATVPLWQTQKVNYVIGACWSMNSKQFFSFVYSEDHSSEVVPRLSFAFVTRG